MLVNLDEHGYNICIKNGGAALEVVGTWAYDILSIEDEIPEGYKEKSVLFFQVRYR